jgi:hypothetical protein
MIVTRHGAFQKHGTSSLMSALRRCYLAVMAAVISLFCRC